VRKINLIEALRRSLGEDKPRRAPPACKQA
jgi:hypothetical protein